MMNLFTFRPALNTIISKTKTFGKAILFLSGLYLIAVATHTIWLGWMSGFLIFDQSHKFRQVDLLVTSTGSYERFRYAVDLMKEGRAKLLLLLGDKRIKTPIDGKSILDLAKSEAIELGLFKKKIIIKNSTAELGFHSAGVISDIYNMRQLAMIFDITFKGYDFDMTYLAVNKKWNTFHPDRWWLYSYEFEYVLKEWIKMPLDFYRLEFLSE